MRRVLVVSALACALSLPFAPARADEVEGLAPRPFVHRPAQSPCPDAVAAMMALVLADHKLLHHLQTFPQTNAK